MTRPSNVAAALALVVGAWLVLTGSSLPDFTDQLARLMGVVFEWCLQHPLIAAGTVVAVAVLASVPNLMMGRGTGQQDPRRIFCAADRKAAFDRAGNRCEYEGWLGLRCRRPAHHADHFYPWTRGGATSIRNLVAACTACNLHKSSHMPTPGAKRRLERRRRRYFPAGVDVAAGEWFGR